MIKQKGYKQIRINGFMLFTFSFLSFALLAQKDTFNENTVKQTDLLDIIHLKMHYNTTKISGNIRERKVYYSFLPTGASVPGGGAALITSTTAGFYLGDRANTFLSTVTFSPYLTFKGKFGYTFRSNLWSNENKWDVKGDIRFLYYPQYTWGLGGDTKESVKLAVNYNYIRFYQTFLRKIKPYFLIGIGYHIDDHFDIDAGGNDSVLLQKFTGYPYGTTSSQSSFSTGLSFNLLYDARRNSINPIPGFYENIVYRFNPMFMGSNKSWQSLYVDTRQYISFSQKKQNMLALWAFYWTVLNGQAPYLDLPSIGWDPYQQRSGRGFDQNRFRGKGLIYFETEYRRDITQNGLFGFILFANMNSVAQPITDRYTYFHMAAGGGLRIKINKHSGTNIAIDYGVSKNFSNISLNLGETF